MFPLRFKHVSQWVHTAELEPSLLELEDGVRLLSSDAVKVSGDASESPVSVMLDTGMQEDCENTVSHWS